MTTGAETSKRKNDDGLIDDDKPSCVQIMAYMSLILVLMSVVAGVMMLIGILAFPGF